MKLQKLVSSPCACKNEDGTISIRSRDKEKILSECFGTKIESAKRLLWKRGFTINVTSDTYVLSHPKLTDNQTLKNIRKPNKRPRPDNSAVLTCQQVTNINSRLSDLRKLVDAALEVLKHRRAGQPLYSQIVASIELVISGVELQLR